MTKRKVSAAEIVADIQKGMSNAELMHKYQVPPEKLNSLFKKLVTAGILSQSEINQRLQSSKTYSCPACGTTQGKKFDECPKCGIVVSKYHDAKQRITQKTKQKDANSIKDNRKEKHTPEKMNKRKKTILFSASTFVAVLLAIYLANYITLQKPLSDVIKSDSRNEGVNFSVHYAYYVYLSELIINVKDVEGDKSAADVFRVFLQYAEKLEPTTFDRVKLASKGKIKFLLKGKYFKILGEEYGTQNPVYTMRTFPENLYKPDGQRAFGSWTGGLLGVVGKQMEDFTEFHKQWYIEDMD